MEKKSIRNIANPNLAKGKTILEEICRTPNVNADGNPINICNTCSEHGKCCKVHNPGSGRCAITDGDTAHYNEFCGYMSVVAPGTITLDLEEVQPIQTIQFLLWDNCGFQKTENCNRKYQYRMLVSTDKKEWHVLFDTFRDGYCGWQRFDLSSPLPMRYIRFHALTINDKTPPPFMVVEIEAYAHELKSYDYRFNPTLHIDINVEESHSKRLDTLDKMTPHKLSRFINTIVNKLQDDASRCGKGRPTLKLQLYHLIQAMESAQHDVIKHEEGVDEIKGKILQKTDDEINKNKRNEALGMVTFVLGILAIIYSIVQLLIR